MTSSAIPSRENRWIKLWLLALGLMVYAMILIGGATRLTDSGLSITEWAPISGALPPLSEAAWIAEFEKYKTTAEYRFQNSGMSLSEFQYIYWWEWGHRLFGRLIGVVAIAGLAFFALRGWLSGKRLGQAVLLVGLGGLQGFIGWWMVASGIGETTRIDVAPYRLATHFGLALIILGMIAWMWARLDGNAREGGPELERRIAWGLAVLIFVQMVTGALVAGLDAGRTYTDWPLMAGEIYPSNYIEGGLGARSLFEGRAATQFNHRILAYLLLAAAFAAAFAYRHRRGFLLLAGLVSLQAVMGVVTLLNAAPLTLALMHQGLGVIVFLIGVVVAAGMSGASHQGAVSSDVSTNTA